jgi:hypothetical protein
MGMTQPVYRLWARFAEPRTPGAKHNITTVHPYNYYVEFAPDHPTRRCTITMASPESPVWARTPVVGTLARRYNRKHTTESGTIIIHTETARVLWGMLIRSGWHTSVADASRCAPTVLLSQAELDAVVSVEVKA